MFRPSKAVFAWPTWISTLLLTLVFAGAARPGMAASATLVQTDTTTGGTWKGLYGSEGAIIATAAGDPANAPFLPNPNLSYYTPALQFDWAPSTALTKALLKTGSNTERIGSTFYAQNSDSASGITGYFDVLVNINDGQTHKVTLYAVDWEPQGRVQRIEVYDANTGTLLSTTTQQNFSNGVYSTWDVQGLVLLRIIGTGNGSPVVSGLFFGATPGATTTILNPQPGNVSGQIALTASVTAPSGVASVQFKLDGSNVGSLITTGNPSYTTNWTANPAGAHNLTVEVTDSFGRKFLSNPVAINILPTVIQNSATFIKTDTPSPKAGDWKNAYGQDGHIIPGDPPNVIPSYLNLKSVTSVDGGANPLKWTYTDTASDPDLPIAMQWNGTPPSSITDGSHVINNPARNPSVFYDTTQIAYDMDFTDGQSHQVAIYLANFETTGRTETITILNGDTNAVLDTQTASNFQVGKYYIWTITGHVKIRFDKVDGSNLIFSGFYFGGGLQPPTISITSPSPGPVVGAVTLTANASSGEGNPKVQFKVDGVNLGSQILAPPYTMSWPTNSIASGSHVLSATATDSLGQSTTASVTVSVNNPPPTVSLTFPTQDGHVFGSATLTATAASASGSIASVQFLLDGAVIPGTVTGTGPYSLQWDSNTAGNGNHTFAVKATDTLGQTTTTSPVTAMVSNGGPSVSITAPAAGPVSGTVTLTANAIQTQAPVQSVQFMLGNTAVNGPISGAGPTYSTTLNTATKASGSYQLTAVATDTLGQIGTSAPVTITISNPPPVVSMTAPSGTQTGTITLSANATSASGSIVSVQFKVDGTPIDTAVAGAGPSFTKQWNTGGVSTGPHTLTAVGTDSLGQTTESAGVPVTVSNPPPTISITSPTSGGSVSGTVTIQASTASAIGIASVTFKLDGTDLGAPVVGAGPTYSFAWQASQASTGPHTLTAVALDKQGQSGTSQPVNVTVGNAPQPSATFLKQDTTTLGNWTGKYGTDGFVIAGNTTQLPAYITAIPVPPLVPAGGQLYIYPATITPAPRHLLKNGSTDRVIAAYYTDTSFTYDFDFIDGQTHQFAVYAYDQEGNTRDETISILNANTNAVLNSQNLTNFNGGMYVQWNIQGHVKVQITKNGLGQSAVVSGFFFDSQLPPPPPPTISLLPISPTLSGTVDLSANAASSAGIKNVQFKFDGTNLGSPVTGTGPIYTYTWDTKTKSNGTHTITAVVTDIADQTVTSTPQTVAINNPITPPVITLTAPAAGTVIGTVTVSASVSAVAGLTSVQFLLDGAPLGALQDGSSSNPSIQWNSAQASQGAHTLSAKAKDAVGQETTSASIAVTVANPVPGAQFSRIDSTTFGNWKGKYGTDGWLIPNDTNNTNPSYGTITPPTGGAGPAYTWSGSTLNISGLQKGAAGSTDRIASVYYSANNAVPFTFDVNITDGNTHELALYMWDLEASGRAQDITFLNANTNAVLLTQSVSNFNTGTYVVFKVTGHVLVRVKWTAGLNAVIGGLFIKTLAPPPTVSVTAPSPASVLTGTVTLSATASATAPTTLTSVQFNVDGNPVGAPVAGAGPNFTTQWNTAGVASTSHAITAVATDSTGQTGTSAPVNISTSNVLGVPVISFTNPAAGPVSGVVTVTANAVSPAGVASVQFKLDGVNLGSLQTSAGPNYSVSWDTKTASNGTHTLTAVAVDKQASPLSATATVVVTSQYVGPSARFMKTDTTTKGNWKGVYGADGYIIPNDSNTPPSYLTLSGPGAAGPIWAYTSTNSVSALLKGSSSDRATSVYYSATNSTPFSFDMNFTDANEHELALYMWDREPTGRSETITILNADTNAVLLTQPLSNFADGLWAVFNVKSHVIVRVQWTGGQSAVINGLFFATPAPPPAPPTVSIVAPAPNSSFTGGTVTLTANAVATSPATLTSVQFKVDGNSIGAHITTGGPLYTTQWSSSSIANGTHILTAVATDSFGQIQTSAGVSVTTATDPTLPKISITNPVPGPVSGVVSVTATASASAGVASVQFKLNGVNLGALQSGSGPTYSVSWDTTGLSGVQTLTAVVTDKSSTPLTATSPAVNVTITAPTSATFVKIDTTTRGNWKGVYGGDGYIIPSDSNAPPSYVTVTPPGSAGPVWQYPPTSSTSALLKGASATDRIASAYYTATNATPFAFDMKFTDGQIHEMALYLWDLENFGRAENVTILNGDTNVVLLTQPVTNFGGGSYAVFKVSGHVLVRISWTSGGPSAVVNGLFFATPAPPPAPPAVSISAPVSGATVVGNAVTLTASATANGSATMASVQFLVDGNAISAPVSGTGPIFTTTWNSTGVTNTTHSLTAIATDSLGQKTTSSGVSFATNNAPTPPVITITNPVPGPVTGVVTLTANAGSSAGIASVQFKVNGGNVGALQTGAGPIYSVAWDTTGLTGTQTITAVAIDKNASPLTTTSAPVNVTIATGPSATFLKIDTATKGNWKGVYGADGYIIPSDSNVPPSYVTVTLPGAAGPVWQYPPTASASALLKGASATDRIASAYYTATNTTPFAFDMRFTDSQPHELALYLWDLENFGRAENITILNGDTNAVLLTQPVTNFGGGSYAVFRVSGHVLVRVSWTTGGPSAVLNGLFFATPPPPPPPPAVSITTPVGGASLTGLTTLTATATANAPSTMKSLQFKLDGVAIGAPLLGAGPSYTMAWDSSGQTAGSHTLTAVATDSLDQTATSAGVPVTIIVIDSPPSISLTSPTPGNVTGMVTVSATATASKGVASVQFKVDGNNYGAVQTGAGPTYSIPWDTTGLTGSHFLSAVATDKNVPARSTESTHLNVTVVNGNPTGAFMRFDTSTQGNWKGVYGADGAVIPNNFNNLTASTTVSDPPANGIAYSWGANTWTDPRALLQGNSTTLRIASTYYSAASMTFDVNFTDIAKHELALYLWDLDGGNSRAESISILDANTNVALATQPVSSFGNGVYAVFNVSGHVLVKVTRTGGQNALVNGLFFKTLEAPPPPPPPPSVSITGPASGATLTGTVTLAATAVANSPATMASVQFRLDGNAIGSPVQGVGPSYSMQWNSATSINGAHKITVVAVDSTGQSNLSSERSVSTLNSVQPPTVSITAPSASSTVSGIVTISATANSNVGIASVQFKLDGSPLGAPITGGPNYTLQWNTNSLSGQHTLTAVATDLQPVPQSAESAPIAVTVSAPTNSAYFVKSDIGTKGNWKGAYGADGFIIPNDSNMPPGYATVAVSGGTPYTWNISSGDPRALQKGSNVVTERIASTYYSSANSFTVDVKTTDGQLHQMALYFVDIDTVTRKQTVQILNADTNDVLSTQQLPTFSGGTYLVYNIRGHIVVKISNAGGTPNILLNGMFFRSFTGLTAPSVDITNPTGGTLTGPVTIAANATSPQGISTVQIQLNGANLGAPLTGAGPGYTQKWATPGTPDGTYTLTAVATDVLGLVSTSQGYTITLSNGLPPTPSAVFVKKDTLPEPPAGVTSNTYGNGDWVGKYGSDGFLIAPASQSGISGTNPTSTIPAGSLNVPYYVNLDLNGATIFTWNGQDTNPDQKTGLQKSPTDLLHHGTTFEVVDNGSHPPLIVDLNFIDNLAHQSAFYFVDWHHTERQMTIDVLDANTGQVLDSQTLNPVGPWGTYLVYNLRGHVKLRVSQINRSTNLSPIVSGMFFGPVQ